MLRDGDEINFQRASATLDGCVKIYSSRVDSAATETGRLISGLATRNAGDKETASDSEDSEDAGDEGPQRKPTKLRTRATTLLDFKQIRLKNMELELYVDPLFKKALADFDEGGSKSLLLNMLSVDPRGKVIFDTTDSAQSSQESNYLDMMDLDDPDEMSSADSEKLISDVTSLGERHLHLALNQDIVLCPSIRELRSVVDQKATSAELMKGLESIQVPDAPDYDVANYQTTYQDFDISFSAQEIREDEENNRLPTNRTSIFFDDLDDDADDYGITMRMLFDENKSYVPQTEDADMEPTAQIPDDQLLAYFDDNQRRNWAGPEHWKISKIKRVMNIKPAGFLNETDGSKNATNRAPKEKLTIDFLSDEYPDDKAIFEKSGATMYLPKVQWISKDKNLLPDDKNFKTKHFITLFTKDKLLNARFNHIEALDQAIDETLYAEHNMTQVLPEVNQADFYNDADVGGGGADDDYFDPAFENVPSQAFSSQLITKSHGAQNPLTYARASKKVDVKLLKDNLWDTLNVERSSVTVAEQPELLFSQIVSGLGNKYDTGAKKDLSTSFCFICLLHLANEHEFTISNTQDNSDLIIKKFQHSIS